jgi:hypothetical protein
MKNWKSGVEFRLSGPAQRLSGIILRRSGHAARRSRIILGRSVATQRLRGMEN